MAENINFPPITEYEKEEAHKNFISFLKDNPNNFSFWFPKVKSLDALGVAIPKTTIVPMDEALIECFFMEREGDKAQIMEWIMAAVCPVIEKEFPSGDVFIKNGCYSGKFNFQNSCLLRRPFSPEDVFHHIMQFQYDSLMFDAGGNLEIVLREYIPCKDNTKCIYSGMPLRPEMRVFYDFSIHAYLYDVNYWDWAYCHDRICGFPEDGKNYEAVYPELMAAFSTRRALYLPLIKKALAGVTQLSGCWSVDFMLDGDRCWLIDMALAQQSAYWDMDKAVDAVKNPSK